MAEGFVSVLKGVRFSYPRTDTAALDGVDLEIRAGEWIALLGPNGSGKSTLAKHLNALLAPTQGVCLVCGRDTRDEKALEAIRRLVAMVFQNPDNQLVAAVVEEDAAFGPENAGLPPEVIRSRVDWALSVCGLSGKERSPVYTLSGGQKQRLAVAGALAMEPPCLVLDEATAMLDPQGRTEIMDVVADLNGRGMTIVQITHRLEEVVSCDRVAVIDGGVLRWQGTPLDLFSLGSESLASWGLETPPFIRLWQELCGAGLLDPAVPPSPKEVLDALCR
jgi:energy-coupling factor transport system ATP-binding protein